MSISQDKAICLRCDHQAIATFYDMNSQAIAQAVTHMNAATSHCQSLINDADGGTLGFDCCY